MYDILIKGVEDDSVFGCNVIIVDFFLEIVILENENFEIEFRYMVLVKRDWRFWVLLVFISFVGLFMVLEGIIILIVFFFIVNDFGGGYFYVWVVNGYLFVMWVNYMFI